MWRVQGVGRLEEGDRAPGPAVGEQQALEHLVGAVGAEDLVGRRPRGVGQRLAQLGGLPVGVAVEVDVAEAAAGTPRARPSGGGNGDSLVLSRTSTSTCGRVVAGQRHQVGDATGGATRADPPGRPARRRVARQAGPSPSHRLGVGRQALGLGQGDHVRAERRPGPASLTVTAWMWRRKSSTRRAQAKRAVRLVGQHVVGAGQVVAQAGRRARAEEDGPGRRDQGQQRLGVVDEQLEVLGGHHVGHGQACSGRRPGTT